MVVSMIQCSHKCLASSLPCLGANFNTIPIKGRYQCEIVHIVNGTAEIEPRNRWVHLENNQMVSTKLLKSSYSVRIGGFWEEERDTNARRIQVKLPSCSILALYDSKRSQ